MAPESDKESANYAHYHHHADHHYGHHYGHHHGHHGMSNVKADKIEHIRPLNQLLSGNVVTATFRFNEPASKGISLNSIK